MIRARIAVAAGVLGCACGDPAGSSGLFGEGGIADGGSSSASAAGSAGQDGGGSEDRADEAGDAPADESGGPLFDVGNGDTEGASGCVEGDCGCTAVDILFVIDDSTSMGSYQQGLAAAAPDFADAIFAGLPAGTDLHVGVTTSSFYGGSGGTSPGEINCSPYYEGAGLTGRDDLYEWYWTPDEMPYDDNGAQGRLRVHEGLTYFATTTDADPSAMKDWLVGNITAVGESGSVWEMVAAGAAYPFHPANAAHNAGFVRDEGAVLVILTLTDEVDNSPEDMQVYHDMIAGAKANCGGDACIVTAGIHKPCLATAPDNVLYPLLASFGEQPAVADIGPELDNCFDDCADGDITHCDAVNPPVTCAELAAGEGTKQYAEALGGALAGVIAQTCADIPPAG